MRVFENWKKIAFFIALSPSLYATENLELKRLEDLLEQSIPLKSDIGTREGEQNFLISNNSIDIITQKQIEQSHQTQLTDLLKYYVAGFNTTHTSLTDGSDHIRSFSLRGMSSDQILVFINGKRVHKSALFHESTGLFQGGSSHVDLNTIPLIAIEKIEILRDGASAQYGSDAISGIINIVLKKENSQNKVKMHMGQRKAGDGTRLQFDSFSSLDLPYDGFLNIVLSGTTQDQTQRAGLDRRDTNNVRKTTQIGVENAKNVSALVDSEIVVEDNIFYITGTFTKRKSESNAFFRHETVLPSSEISENFLPMIAIDMSDYSFTSGMYGTLHNGLDWDISNRFGYNKIEYGSFDSKNYDLATDGTVLRSFQLGELIFLQNSVTVDLKKQFDDFTLAGGVEYKYENYQIKAGEADSYYLGGSQGYSGYMPENAVDNSRKSYAFYYDSTYNFNADLSGQFAGRYENYSDFGETTNIKVALGYQVTPKIHLRTTGSTGFRAPSLAQNSFSHSSTALVNNTLLQKGIFTPEHKAAQSIGATQLEPELSEHISFGGVYTLGKKSHFMIDFFYTKVTDKILLTDKQMLSEELQKIYAVSSVSYLINGLDTRTRGVDIKYTVENKFRKQGYLESIVWLHYNENEVIASRYPFLDARITTIEKGQSQSMIKFSNHYTLGKFEYSLNISRFSKFSQNLGGEDYHFSPMVTVDTAIDYQLSKNISLSVGGDNIFDEMPDKWTRSNAYLGYDGILPYSNNSPIGYSGAYYYVQMGIKF